MTVGRTLSVIVVFFTELRAIDKTISGSNRTRPTICFEITSQEPRSAVMGLLHRRGRIGTHGEVGISHSVASIGDTVRQGFHITARTGGCSTSFSFAGELSNAHPRRDRRQPRVGA